MKLPHFLTALGVNAVPALGWLIGDWSSGTTLAVYWFESVAASLFIALRVIIHRRFVRVRGHYRYEAIADAKQATSTTYLSNFLPIALIFSGGHAFFLLVLGFLLTKNGHGAEVRWNLHEMITGCGLVTLLLAIDFLFDLPRMKTRPFRWIEVMGQRNLGRVAVMHLTLIFGMLGGAVTDSPRGFFLVFVILKTMADLSNVVPQYDPAEAPRWLCALMDKVPNINPKNIHKGQTFAEFWREDKAREVARVATNEKPFSP